MASPPPPDDRFAEGERRDKPVRLPPALPPADERYAEGERRPKPVRFPQAAPPADEDLPSLSGNSGGDGLSSLAQSARDKQINIARWTLIVIGVLSIIVNIVMMFLVQHQINDEIRKGGLNPNNLPPDMAMQVNAALLLSYAMLGGFIVVGLVFIVLGALVRQYPVACTVAGLVLYILAWLISGLVDPKNFITGILIKIIIIVALVKALQAALASEREKRTALAGFDDDGP